MRDTIKKPDPKGVLSELVGEREQSAGASKDVSGGGLQRGTPVAGLEPHPLAEAFPLWVDETFMNDIRDHGVRIPIVLYEGKILDGRNRVAAAKRAGQTNIIYTGFEGSFDQARDFVVSMNLARRHLDTGQRAMIASELASMKQGARTDLVQNCTMSVPDAAKALNVSVRTTKIATAIRKTDPALANDVKQGKVKLAKAAKIVAKKVPAAGEKKPGGVEIKRHDERMKNARYKLEAFIRDYSDMAEWKEVYRGNQNIAWSETCLIVCFILVQEFGLSPLNDPQVSFLKEKQYGRNQF